MGGKGHQSEMFQWPGKMRYLNEMDGQNKQLHHVSMMIHSKSLAAHYHGDIREW